MIFGLIFANKIFDQRQIYNFQIFDAVRCRETVHNHHGRNARFFCQFQSDKSIVIYFLRIFRKYLDPAQIAHCHHIFMVSVNVYRRRNCPRAHEHQNRKPHSRSNRQNLAHQHNSLRARSCYGSNPGRLRAYRRAHRAMLRFHFDHFRVRFAIRHKFRKSFDDRRLRRNGINRHHIGIYLPQGLRRGRAAG